MWPSTFPIVTLACLAPAAIAQNIDIGATVAHDLFVASDLSVAITLNHPSNTNDLYFSLVGPSTASWISVGFGSDRMSGAYMFIAYTSADKISVTVSPRKPAEHVEPYYDPDLVFEVVSSSTANKTLTANVRCTNCTELLSVDVTQAAQKMIYGAGPNGAINSDSMTVDLKRHSSYGSFTVDMTKTTGDAGFAAVPTTITEDLGSQELTNKADHDFSPALHAAVMVFAFVFLMPLGIILLRVFSWVKWHGVNQALSLFLAIIGAGLGVYIGRMYNRSKMFNTAHQLLGLVIILALIAQFVLGCLHHRMYKRTLSTTKMAPVHVWLGRAVILAGTVNSFLGFPLALSPSCNYWLIGVILIVAIPFILIMIWKQRRVSQKTRQAEGVVAPSAYPLSIRHEGVGLQDFNDQEDSRGNSRSNSSLNLNTNSLQAHKNAPASASRTQENDPVEPWQRI